MRVVFSILLYTLFLCLIVHTVDKVIPLDSVLTAVQANNARALTLLLNGHRSACDVDKALIYATREGFAECVACLLKGLMVLFIFFYLYMWPVLFYKKKFLG